MTETRAFRIGDWDIVPEQDQIRRDGRSVNLRPQIMDLLVMLAERAGSVVTPEEIMEGLWERRFVTQASVYTSIGELRSVLDDDHHHPRYIKTIPKRGYQLIATVSRDDGEEQPVTKGVRWWVTRPGAPRLLGACVLGIAGVLVAWQFLVPPQQQPVRPRGPAPANVAVLPFELVGEFAEASHLSYGLPAEIQRRLADDPMLRVTALRSSLAVPASADDPRALTKLLNATHLLRGAITEADSGMNLRLQLVEASGNVVWQTTFEGNPSAGQGLALEVQQQVRDVLMTNEPAAATAPVRLTSFQPEYSTWEHYLIALEHSQQSTLIDLQTAETHLLKLLDAEPDHVDARILLGEVYLDLAGFHSFYGEHARTKAREAAQPHLERALSLRPDSARAHAAFGHLYVVDWRSEFAKKAEEHLNTAIELNPNLADAHYRLGKLEQLQVRSWTGLATRFETAMALDPLWQEAAFAAASVLTHLPHRHKEAERIIDRLRADAPEGIPGLRAAAKLEIARGELADAARLLETALAISPSHGAVRFKLSEVLHSLGDSTGADEGLGVWSHIWSLVLSDDRQLKSEWTSLVPARMWQEMPVRAFAQMAYACVMIENRECMERLHERYLDDDESFRETLAGLDGTVYSTAVSFATYLQSIERFPDAAPFIQREEQAIDIRTDGQQVTSAEISRLQARVYALQGNHYAALRALHNYAQYGSLDPRVFRHPVYKPLLESGELTAIRSLQEQRAEHQRIRYGLISRTARLADLESHTVMDQT